MRNRVLISASAVCLLAACTGAQETPVASPENTSAPAVAAPPQDNAAPLAPHQIGPPAQAPVREAVRVPPEPEPMPEVLLGLAPSAVDELLGSPDLVRLDGPAEVRLYRNTETACTFHVFLYPSASNAQTKAVEHFEARDPAGRLDDAEVANCYRGLVKPAEAS